MNKPAPMRRQSKAEVNFAKATTELNLISVRKNKINSINTRYYLKHTFMGELRRSSAIRAPGPSYRRLILSWPSVFSRGGRVRNSVKLYGHNRNFASAVNPSGQSPHRLSRIASPPIPRVRSCPCASSSAPPAVASPSHHVLPRAAAAPPPCSVPPRSSPSPSSR